MTVLFLGALTATTFFQSRASARPDCPAQIALSGPRFINGQEFPTADQVRTNFNQSIHVAGGAPAWSQADLKTANRFVQALKANLHQDQVILTARLTPQGCVGTFAGMAFSVGSDETGTEIDFEYNSADNWPDSISIFGGSHSEVLFVAHLPSNCSNCSSSAELLEFTDVSASNP